MNCWRTFNGTFEVIIKPAGIKNHILLIKYGAVQSRYQPNLMSSVMIMRYSRRLKKSFILKNKDADLKNIQGVRKIRVQRLTTDS